MICEYCDKTFVCKSNLNRHFKRSRACSRLSDMKLKNAELTSRVVALDELRLDHETKIQTLHDEINRLVIETMTSEGEIKTLKMTNQILLNKITEWYFLLPNYFLRVSQHTQILCVLRNCYHKSSKRDFRRGWISQPNFYTG